MDKGAEVSVESIINNPPKEFTEPCEACGVSEFQLGVSHAEERIIKLLEKEAKGFNFIRNFYAEAITSELIGKIKGEQK
jgi:deoxyribodipyrimidine photolyase